jgi:hypothetical protein
MALPIDWEFYQNRRFIDRLGATLRPEQVNPDDYAAIYFAGGHGVIWDFPDNAELQKLSATHVEEIVEWQPNQRLQLQMKGFSPPLSRLATVFAETWEFQRIGDITKVIRSFEMNAKSIAAWPVLWLISFVLKRAIDRHLIQIRSQS